MCYVRKIDLICEIDSFWGGGRDFEIFMEGEIVMTEVMLTYFSDFEFFLLLCSSAIPSKAIYSI